MPGGTQLLRRKRQTPSASANGSPGGLERGGRHGLKPMLRPPSTSSVTMPRRSLPGGYRPTEWMSDGQRCAALRVGVGIRRPGRNDARDESRSLGFSSGTNFSSPLKSPVFLMDGAEQECSGYILSLASGMLGLRLSAENDSETRTVYFGSAGASPSQGELCVH